MFKKAYSLMEAMIAIAVLSSVTVVALNTITNSADTEVLNKDYITTLMLIDSTEQEILSLYKNNIEKFGAANKASCGLNIDVKITDISKCAPDDPNKSLRDGKYIIYSNPNEKSINVVLVEDANFTEDKITENFNIYEVPIDDTDNFLFTQNPELNSDPKSKQTKYFKIVEVEKKDDVTVITIKAAFKNRNDKYTIQSKNIYLNLTE